MRPCYSAHISESITIALTALISFGAVLWIFPRILKIAKTKGLVDIPDGRKLQEKAVPILGGIAVFFGFLAGLFAYMALGSGSFQENATNLFPILVATCIMLYTGSIDDISGLTPITRLLIEILAISGLIYGSGMCIDSFHGLWGIQTIPMIAAVPLTIFAGVGIINAYNMVDGVNGLSSGLCIAVCTIMGVFFFLRHDYSDAALTAAFGAALIPFYLHNVFGNTSKMFIGDSGTMVIGVLVSWFAIRALSSRGFPAVGTMSEGSCPVAMMLAIASVPVFDTLRVMSFRIIRGQSPFTADKTHLHHAFILSGVSHFVTGLSELLINLAIIGIWYCCFKIGLSQEIQLYATIAAGVIFVWGTYIFLHHQEKHDTDWFRKFKRITRVTHTEGRPWWLRFQQLLDRGTEEE